MLVLCYIASGMGMLLLMMYGVILLGLELWRCAVQDSDWRESRTFHGADSGSVSDFQSLKPSVESQREKERGNR